MKATSSLSPVSSPTPRSYSSGGAHFPSSGHHNWQPGVTFVSPSCVLFGSTFVSHGVTALANERNPLKVACIKEINFKKNLYIQLMKPEGSRITRPPVGWGREAGGSSLPRTSAALPPISLETSSLCFAGNEGPSPELAC